MQKICPGSECLTSRFRKARDTSGSRDGLLVFGNFSGGSFASGMPSLHAEESVEIEIPDAAGLIACDHAIVRLIKSSKVEIVGKKTRLVEQPPELWDLKAAAQGWGAMIHSGLPCWSDA